MNNLVLTIVDTLGIQRYIFGSNQLAQNVGASYLVKQATHQWVIDALPSSHNVLTGLTLEESLRIEDGKLDAEVVYMGGGNAVILFKAQSIAREFARKLTRRALVEAPGLQIILAHSEPFDWKQNALGGKEGVFERTMRQLNFRKQSRSLDTPLLGQSVTVSGVFSGLPATTHDKENRPISSETQAKVRAAEQAHELLKREFDWGTYEIPKDLDHFGRSEGEKSFIAIIHADVNGMGKKAQSIRDQFPEAPQNRDYVQSMRSFSKSMKDAATRALDATIDLLKHCVGRNKEGFLEIVGKPDNGLRVPLRGENGLYWLPFRPIIYGGDDVTFITDGRLGLSLAAYYLETLTQQTLVGPNGDMPLSARAGVAIAKTHFPFAHAYALTEELIACAKSFIRDTDEEDLTALDWHFITGSLLTSLKTTREKEYRAANDNSLVMRPVALSTNYHLDWRTWTTFKEVTEAFQTRDIWRDRRNKIKALREILREGAPEAVEHFLKVYSLKKLPPIPFSPNSRLPERGWEGARTPYFDAIEAMNFFIPLNLHFAP